MKTYNHSVYTHDNEKTELGYTPHTRRNVEFGNSNTIDFPYQQPPKAGLIPYIREDGEVKFLTMISSDPKFGGPKPMISKGGIEDGETAIEAAIREAEEELGLRRENIIGSVHHLTSEIVVLYSGTYQLDVYYCQVQDRYDFDKWCDETLYTQWMSLSEFQSEGRRDHIPFIRRVNDIVA